MNYDKVIICGKGPTAEFAQNDTGCLVGLNTAITLFDRVDFLVTNDVETFDRLDRMGYDYSKVGGIILPEQLHRKERVCEITCVDIMKRIGGNNFYPYRLPTQIVPSMGGPEFKCKSTYHTALQWFIHNGCMDFKIYGVSRECEYHDRFKNGDTGNSRNDGWYEENFDKGVEILEKGGCRYSIFIE